MTVVPPFNLSLHRNPYLVEDVHWSQVSRSWREPESRMVRCLVKIPCGRAVGAEVLKFVHRRRLSVHVLTESVWRVSDPILILVNRSRSRCKSDSFQDNLNLLYMLLVHIGASTKSH